jgi:hypothetical protein
MGDFAAALLVPRKERLQVSGDGLIQHRIFRMPRTVDIRVAGIRGGATPVFD